MKKKYFLIILTLIVPLLLCAIESDPSEVVGFVKFDLGNDGSSGYNVFTTPFQVTAGTNISSIYNNITNCENVSFWNPDSQMWKSYDAQPWTPDWNVDPATAYMCHVSAGSSFYVYGKPVQNASYTLKSGKNLIMLPFEQSDITDCAQLMNAIPGCSSVMQYDKTAQDWVEYTGSETVWNVTTGMGYVVTVTSETVWPTVQGD